ncbi:MAG: Jag N-terminal domain-containing protein [Oscillospiraceae bacterium]
MQKITETGKTVDIAVENALKKLGLSRDDVTVEVLEMPIKKFIGGKPAKVELTVIGSETESDNEQATKETVKTQPKTEALKQDVKENSDLPAAQSDKARQQLTF